LPKLISLRACRKLHSGNHKLLSNIGEQYNDYPMMMNYVKECVAKVVAEQMEIFGSRGQAASQI